MIELHADDWFQIAGRGWVAAIKNTPEQLPLDIDPSDLLGQTVSINGEEYFVTGVERQGYSRRHFGLLIRGAR